MLLALWGHCSLRGAEPGPGGSGLGGVGMQHPRTASEIIPPPAVEAENAAPLYLEALAVLEAAEVWGSHLAELAAQVHGALYAPSAPGNLIAVLEGFRVPEAGNRPPTVAEACAELARRLQSPAAVRVMELLEEAARRPRCRFDIDYGKGPETLLPHLAKMRALSRFAAAAAMTAVEQGDASAAWDWSLLGLRLADGAREEPLVISQLVRIAQASMAMAALQKTAEAMAPDAAEAGRADGLLACFEDPAPWARALEGERLLLAEWLLGQTPEKARELLSSAAGADAFPLAPEQIEAGARESREALLRLAELARLPHYQAAPAIEALFQTAAGAGASPVARILLPALSRFFQKTAEFQALARVTRLGLRLRQFRSAGRAYPSSLEALDLTGVAPETLMDPFTGERLRYRPEEAGFVLYSLGPDREDNAGAPRQGDARSGYDIVWRAVR